MSAASIAAEVEGVGGWGGGGGQPVSAQTTHCTQHKIGRPRGKPLLQMMHKKACKQLDMDYRTWITGFYLTDVSSSVRSLNKLGFIYL